MLNVTLTAKIKMLLWNTYINNYRAPFNKIFDVYKQSLQLQLSHATLIAKE